MIYLSFFYDSQVFVDTIKKILGAIILKQRYFFLHVPCPIWSHWSHCHMDGFFLDIIFVPHLLLLCHWPQESGGLTSMEIFDIFQLRRASTCAGEVLRTSSTLTCFLFGSGAPWCHTAISNYWWSLENTVSSCKRNHFKHVFCFQPSLWNLGFHQDFLSKFTVKTVPLSRLWLPSEEIIYDV